MLVRMSSLASLLVLMSVSCTGGVSTSDSSLECFNTAGGLVCVSADQARDGEPTDADGDGQTDDWVCEDTGCIQECVDTDAGEVCEISCEGGLHCITECHNVEGDDGTLEQVCETECACPRDGEPGCDEAPDRPECQEPPYCETHPDDFECLCEANPEHPECVPYCETHPDDPECLCEANPEHPECLPYCETHPDDPECFCEANPEHPECVIDCAETPDHPECFCEANPEHPECQGGA